MALSGSVTTTSSNNRSVTLSWTATQDISNNQSTISWSLTGSGSFTGYVVVSEIRITINGSQAYYRGSSNHTNCYQGTTLCSGSKVITHNNDGTKSFSIKVEAGIYNWAINCSGQDTFTLNTIPRSSSITSASNVTLGNYCSVKWTPASDSFQYKLKFSLGSWSHTTAYIAPGHTSAYTYTDFQIPLAVANQLPNSTTGTMTVYLYTYKGTEKIGTTASKTFTVTVPASIKPTGHTVNVSMVNSNSKIDEWDIAVAGYTKVEVSSTAAGNLSSTIGSFEISGGYSKTIGSSSITYTEYVASMSYTGAAIQTSGDKSFTVKATDSRGRDSTVSSNTIHFYAYSKPTISTFTVSRGSGSSANRVSVTADWSYSSVNGNNSVTVKLLYKKHSDTSWTTYGGTISKNTSITITATFDEAVSHDFRLVVTDAIGNKAQKDVLISTMSVLMDFRAGGKGLGIGKISEENSLEVALQAKFFKQCTKCLTSDASKVIKFNDNMFWQPLTLASGITAQAYGGYLKPMIRMIGDRVDIIGAVEVTWDGTNVIPLITGIPSALRCKNTHYWVGVTTGTRAAEIVKLYTTGGNINLASINAMDGTKITTARYIEINTSFFIIDDNNLKVSD